jgi:ABC-type sugar transport system ATPase subunit
MMARTDSLLAASNLVKSFGGTVVLDGVDFQVSPGEIHGLVGENGAGKSTLLKIFIGAHQPDAGEMRLCNVPFRPRGPQEAQSRGISLVPQELKIIPQLSVADNVMLARWPVRRFGAVNRKEVERCATEDLERIGLKIDPRRTMATLSFAERQLVVIARALSLSAKVIILDEPTASLERADVDRLFLLLERLRDDQVGMIFVSHRLDEIQRISDRVTILRDGNVVACHLRGTYTENDLIRHMTGRGLERVMQASVRPAGATLFSAEVEAEQGRQELSLKAGRNTGLAGLLGSGTGDLLGKLFGSNGEIKVVVRGTHTSFSSPRDAIAHGVGYVPSERARTLFGDLSVRDNIILPHLDRFRSFGRLDTSAADRVVLNLIALLDIRPRKPELAVSSLSGGNQQKVIFARWVTGRFHTLLLDEPTHGIDIAAKTHILRHLVEFVAVGNAVLLASTEFNELLALSDEIVTIRDGKVAGTLVRDSEEFSELHLRSILGG